MRQAANGCGGDSIVAKTAAEHIPNADRYALLVQSFLGNVRKYAGHEVPVHKAGDVHDAGCTGVTVLDPGRNLNVDFRTLESQTGRRALHDGLPDPGQEARPRLLAEGLHRRPQREAGQKRFERPHNDYHQDNWSAKAVQPAWWRIHSPLGAETHVDIVRNHGAGGYDADVTVPGTQGVAPAEGTTPAGGGRAND